MVRGGGEEEQRGGPGGTPAACRHGDGRPLVAGDEGAVSGFLASCGAQSTRPPEGAPSAIGTTERTPEEGEPSAADAPHLSQCSALFGQ